MIRDVKIIHFIPGRVRLRIQEIKENAKLAREIQQAFINIPGITTVDMNPLTGSVLIKYDPKSLLQQASLDQLSETLTKYFPSLDLPKLLAWIKSSH